MSDPQQLGPYRIVRPLGQGGMGAVYEAVQEPIGRRVAVKVLLPQHAQDRDAVHRFFNEARAVNLIEHPSIVQVSDFVQEAGRTCVSGHGIPAWTDAQRSHGRIAQTGEAATDA